MPPRDFLTRIWQPRACPGRRRYRRACQGRHAARADPRGRLERRLLGSERGGSHVPKCLLLPAAAPPGRRLRRGRRRRRSGSRSRSCSNTHAPKQRCRIGRHRMTSDRSACEPALGRSCSCITIYPVANWGEPGPGLWLGNGGVCGRRYWAQAPRWVVIRSPTVVVVRHHVLEARDWRDQSADETIWRRDGATEIVQARRQPTCAYFVVSCSGDCLRGWIFLQGWRSGRGTYGCLGPCCEGRARLRKRQHPLDLLPLRQLQVAEDLCDEDRAALG